MRIHVEEEALAELRSALQTAGENYKKNLAKMTRLMNDITNGDIKGDTADDILKKYNDKKDAFNALAAQIDRAEEYAGVKGKNFTSMIEELKEVTK